MKQKRLRLTNEWGAAGIKAIIALLIVAAVIYSGIQLVPIYWDHYSFEDDLNTEVRFLFVNVPSEREKHLNNFIVGRLKEMGAKYEDKNVKVDVDDGKKKVKVDIWYGRPHNLPFYPNPKQFYIHVENTPID